MAVTFEWDEAKARANLSKHGVRFETATRVFADPLHMMCRDDREHDECRYLSIGMVSGKELVVVYTPRGESVRLISAREATRYETFRYWQNRQLHLRPG